MPSSFLEVFERELARAARYQRPLSCVLVDLDRFKHVNDTHGHEVGDRVLVASAQALARGQRRVFVLCADGCLRDVLSHFGVEFRPALVAPDALHQVGCFDLESIDNLERLYEVAYSLGRALELSAA